MKKIKFSLLALFIGLNTIAAHADDFSGSWSGKGFYSDQGAPIDTPIDLTIAQSETALGLKECWIGIDPDGIQRQRCIVSNYIVQNDGQIWTASKKIGEIFPLNLVIFQGNSQVSEQIAIDFVAKDTIHYRYSYLNMDGASIVRDGNLIRK